MAQLGKYYPINGRKDFFKWTIVATGESISNPNRKLHTDYKGEEMYFDDKERAKEVCLAINQTERFTPPTINKDGATKDSAIKERLPQWGVFWVIMLLALMILAFNSYFLNYGNN